MLKAGLAKVNINPPSGTLLAGQLHERRAAGVQDDIFARALVIDNGSTRMVFITSDLVAISSITAGVIRKTIEQTLNIPQAHIIISATHTHSGPLTVDLFGVPAEQNYLEPFVGKIIAVVESAVKNLRLAKIGFASGKAAGISFNRRFIMRNDTIETHPFKGNPEISKPEGPVDPEVGALYIIDSENKITGVLVNFACHATCMERESLLVSADYPGYVEKVICEQSGKNVIVLFANGACGNICQVDVAALDKNEIGASWANKMGTVIGEEVMRIREKVTYLSEANIDVRNRTIKIPVREIPNEQFVEADALKENDGSDSSRAMLSDYGSEVSGEPSKVLSVEDIFTTPFWRKLQAAEILLLNEERKKKAYEEVEITVAILNGSAFVSIPCELFVEFGLEIKKKSRFNPTFIIELANGYAGYIPTHKAFERKGGYETKLARSSKLVPEAGNMIVETALELVDNLKEARI